MNIKKVEYLIIGAGISGISSAFFLKNNKDYLIIERESSIGGYCRTIYKRGFVWDYSGHFFHFRNNLIKKLVLDKIKKKLLVIIKKKAAVIYKDRFITAPFQKNINELEKKEYLECLNDLQSVSNKIKKNKNFLEWLYNNLGKGITEKFIKPYNEKLYACSLDKFDVSAMGRFFPKLDKKNLNKKKDTSYNNKFTYPKTGAITYINALANSIDKKKILLNEKLENINKKKKYIITNKNKIYYKYLISSMPLDKLLKISKTKYKKKIYNSNKVVVFNFGFNKNFDIGYHWLYVPDKKISFYRVGFYSNIIKQSRGSIYVEVGLKKNSKIKLQNLKKKILADLKTLKIIKDHKLITYNYIIMNPAYLHLTKKSILDSQKKVKLLKKNNIYCVGRYAEWKYCSIEDNIISAKKTISEIENIDKH